MDQAVRGMCAVPRRLCVRDVLGSANLDALVRVRHQIGRGEKFRRALRPTTHFALLLEGVACSGTRDGEGVRQIHTFIYPGEIWGPRQFVAPGSEDSLEVEALSSTCIIGTVDADLLDQAIRLDPAVGWAIWRAAMVQANIARQRSMMMQKAPLGRVAHVLCEQLARLGSSVRIIPFTKAEIADAAGVSAVNLNRIIKDLRALGLLGKGERRIEIVDGEGLEEIAGFDDSYLSVSKSQWALQIEG